jgi:5-methylcytosine-specific restriction endonuclease McrA
MSARPTSGKKRESTKGGTNKIKRFTETRKWYDSWFVRLTPGKKLLWIYLCDNCDASGVIDFCPEIAAVQLGLKANTDSFKDFGDRLQQLPSGKWWITRFIEFQYGVLSRDCKPHIPVFLALRKHGIDLEQVSQSSRAGKNGTKEYVRQKVIERDGLTCAYTGRQLILSEVVVDHVIPKSKGGRESLDNLVVSSPEANSLKKDLSLEDYCRVAQLDLNEVRMRINQRLSKAFGKPLDSLQEKEKEKEKDSYARAREERPITKFGFPLPARCSIRPSDQAVLDHSGRVMDINQVRKASKSEAA